MREDAVIWANGELKAYLSQRESAKLSDKRRRTARRQFDRELEEMTYQAMANLVREGMHSRLQRVQESLKFRTEHLWEAYVFEQCVKQGRTERAGVAAANEAVGKNWTQRFAKALEGTLDAIEDVLEEASHERALALCVSAIRARHVPTERAAQLLNAIRRLPGSKVITTTVDDEYQVFDMNAEGAIGYDKSHEALLLWKFDRSLATEGSLIVRQFIPDSNELVDAPNGHTISMPWKALYGIWLGEGGWRGLSAEEVELCCTTNPDGSRSFEELVIYKDANELLG